jgi:predicted RNase H-like HicB family nuclease
MSQYVVIFEHASDGTWSAYVPDLPGCVCSAPTRAAASEAIRSTIAFHLEGMRANGDAIPAPTSDAELVSVA